MGGWTLAQGRQTEQTLGDVVAAGATQIALANANSIFSAGQLLFISEADGTETEFLGGVVQSTSSDVQFTLPLQKSKNSGAKLWRPSSSFVSGAAESLPMQRKVHTGVTLERSLGGVSYAIRTADPFASMELSLAELTPARELALVQWIQSATENGLNSFTLVSPTRAISAVRLQLDEYLRVAGAGGNSELKLTLLIEAEGEYL